MGCSKTNLKADGTDCHLKTTLGLQTSKRARFCSPHIRCSRSKRKAPKLPDRTRRGMAFLGNASLQEQQPEVRMLEIVRLFLQVCLGKLKSERYIFGLVHRLNSIPML